MLINFDSLFGVVDELSIPDVATMPPGDIGDEFVEVTLPESEAAGEEFLIRIAR